MGYFLLLLMIVCSMRAMDEAGSGGTLLEKHEQLLQAIRGANQASVRELLLQGVRPSSIQVDLERDSTHHVNDFVTEALKIEEGSSRVSILQLLLDHGASVDHSARLEGEQKKMPVLSYAIGRLGDMCDPSEEVSLLVAYGAEVAGEDFCGNPPLFHARKRSCPNVIKTLLASGAPSIGVGGETIFPEVREMLEDFGRYQERHQEEIAAIRSRIDELRAEKTERERARRNEQFSVDHDIPRSPRKGGGEK